MPINEDYCIYVRKVSFDFQTKKASFYMQKELPLLNSLPAAASPAMVMKAFPESLALRGFQNNESISSESIISIHGVFVCCAFKI